MNDAEKLAKRFHETYESLAPQMGYETRKASAVPWEQVPEKNRALMIATCNAILEDGIERERVAALEAQVAELRAAIEQVEWKKRNGREYCPNCFNSRIYGHTRNCVWTALGLAPENAR